MAIAAGRIEVVMMQSVHRVGSVACCSFVCLLLCANLVRAQAIHEGKLTGTVAGEDRAVIPGATVEISSPALLGGPRSGTTSDSGTYLFLNLPIGRYTVTASLSGFKTMVRENIDVSADATVSVDLILPVGEIKETVTVSAAGPIVDTKASTIDTRFRSEMLEKLPTSRDAFYDLALTAPGMFEGSGAPSQTTEFQSPTAYGSATNENVFLINGVDATSPRAGSFGALVNVNYDSVEEVRIVATGSKAEYASFSGAAIDVLTKSGSNVFHGSGAFYSKLGTPRATSPISTRRSERTSSSSARAKRSRARPRRTGRAASRWAARSPRTSSGSSVRSTISATPVCGRDGRWRASPGAAMPTARSRRRHSRIIAPGPLTTTRTTTATAGAGARSRSGIRR